MPLVSTKEMFKKAYNNFAIGAFNVNNMEILQGVIEAAKEEKAPLILQISKGARNYAKLVYLMKLIEAAMQDAPDIPICVHLDHGDSFELCKEVIDAGFTSVMIDGSHLPFEENIAITKKVVDYAHPR
ncbi:MAG: class II fructose-bisphosphate aldolase, partial [Dictyoglomaceae bacterium]|nr:class II fructose-bisphosphate aldolase [Dictyoglomaceae bacterium]